MKLLPLLDAYQAPYKDKFRFLTGLILVVRSILPVGYGSNILGYSDINHQCVGNSALLHIVYRNGVQEQSFKYSSIVNLVIPLWLDKLQ